MKNLVSVLLLLCMGQVTAQEVEEFVLDNGLKILVKEDHRAPVVVSQLWYQVGSSYEHDGITGVSHVLEHMMFQGTQAYPDGEFSRIIAENGGRENAFTGRDYTTYFQTLESSRLPISFRLEADRMNNLTLPEEAFLSEIEVVKEERRMRTEDNPGAYTYEVAMATAYQTSPYRQPVIGWMADLDNMEVGDLQRWYDRWYAPNNATLVVIGDVDAEAVHDLAREHFGPLPAETVVTPQARPEIEQQGIKRIVVKRPAEVAELIMAWKAPALTSTLRQNSGVESWEPYALEVLAGILSGGNSARFASELIRGRQVATSVRAGYGLYDRLGTVFRISGTPAREKTVAELETAVREQIHRLQQEPVTAAELDRVKAQVVSGNVYERDSMFYQGMILGQLETVGLSWEMADDYVDRIREVTAAQVREVARRYFTDTSLTVAELEPQPIETAGPQTASAGGGIGYVD